MFFVHSDACLSYVHEFVAKIESFSNPLPRSFVVKSLSALLRVWRRICYCALSEPSAFTFTGQILSLLFCVDSSSLLADLLIPFPRMLSFFLREVINDADAVRPEVGSVCAHSMRACIERC